MGPSVTSLTGRSVCNDQVYSNVKNTSTYKAPAPPFPSGASSANSTL